MVGGNVPAASAAHDGHDTVLERNVDPDIFWNSMPTPLNVYRHLHTCTSAADQNSVKSTTAQVKQVQRNGIGLQHSTPLSRVCSGSSGGSGLHFVPPARSRFPAATSKV